MNKTIIDMLKGHTETFHPCKSSVIQCISYSTYGYMIIEFNSGDSYVYFDMPSKVYDDFVEAESKGKFFNQFIKDRHKSEKLEIN